MAIAGPSRRHFMGRAGCEPSETFSQTSNCLRTMGAETDCELRSYKVPNKLRIVSSDSFAQGKVETPVTAMIKIKMRIVPV